MNSKDLERRLREMAWPEPSASLRERVRSLAVSPVAAPSWADLVWFSRAWRLAAAGVVVALVALEAWSIQVVPGRVPPVRPAETSSTLALIETERDLGLPAGVLVSLARRENTADAGINDERPRDWSALAQFDVTGER